MLKHLLRTATVQESTEFWVHCPIHQNSLKSGTALSIPPWILPIDVSYGESLHQLCYKYNYDQYQCRLRSWGNYCYRIYWMMVNCNTVFFQVWSEMHCHNTLVSRVFLDDSQPLWNTPEHEVILRTIPERIQAIDPMVTVCLESYLR